MLLHVLGHVEPNDRPLIVEHELGKGLRELSLPDAGRPEEDERADRAVRVLEARARPAERIRHGVDRNTLPHHALMEPLLHVHELLDLALEQPVDRNLRPGRDDGGDVVLVHLLLDHRLVSANCFSPFRELLLERRQKAVADLCDTLEIAVTLGTLGLHPQVVDLAGDLLDAVEHVLLAGPADSQLVTSGFRLRELPLHWIPQGRRLLRHRSQFDLELDHTALGLVELDGRRIDLHPKPGRGLVDEVDRLVRQEAIGDVALGKHRGGGKRGVTDADAVMRFVALLEATQNRDRVGHRRLADQHGLKAPLERGILLDVLAVLIERRRTDGPQLTARKHGLEQVPC